MQRAARRCNAADASGLAQASGAYNEPAFNDDRPGLRRDGGGAVLMEQGELARSRARKLAGLFALAGAAIVCAAQDGGASSAKLTLTEKDNDRSVGIRVGDEVEVTLPENASTGYRWATDRTDGEVVDFVSTQPHYPGGAVGSGGWVSFLFRGKSAGTGEIALKPWRSWEGDSSLVARFRVEVRVER